MPARARRSNSPTARPASPRRKCTNWLRALRRINAPAVPGRHERRKSEWCRQPNLRTASLQPCVPGAARHLACAAPALIQLTENGRPGWPAGTPPTATAELRADGLPLLVKLGEVRQWPNGWPRLWWTTEQSSLTPVLIPILSKRPSDASSFGSLQILVSGSEANRATAGDRSQPQAQFKSQSKYFFDLAHGQSPRWQADPPFSWGGCLPLCCPAPLAWRNYSGIKLNAIPGIGLKLFGFIAGSVFTITPEQRSESSRNGVRFDRIPQPR